jgi:predicted PurR-regulated permease PerM
VTARSTSAGQTTALWILAVIASIFFLRAASQLLIPIVIGTLLSYALEPIGAWLERHRVPRLAGASVVLLVALGACGWGAYMLKGNVADAIDALPEAARRAREMISSQQEQGPAARIQEAAGELSGAVQGEAAGKRAGSEQAAGGQQEKRSPGEQARGARGATGEPSAAGTGERGGGGGTPPAILGAVQRGVGSIFALAGHLAVIVFLIFFLLSSGHHVRNRVIEIAGPDTDRRRTAAKILDDVNAQIQRFLLVRLVTAGVVALATWGVLAWMGVPNAAVWGVLAGVFNSIPYFGPVIVSGGLLVVGLVQGGGMTQALQMSGAALLITSIEGWLLTPPLMGKAERMSVLAVFLGLLLWTWIWGAWGTILAVPMLVVIKAIACHVEALRPVGRLMAP